MGMIHRRGAAKARVLFTLIACLGSVLACGDADPGNGAGEQQPARVAPPPAPAASDVDEATREVDEATGEPQPGEPVRIWLFQDESVVAVPRPEAEPSLRSALESLVAGPTAGERSRGLSSWFGEETRGVLRGVRVDAGLAVVDFRSSLPTLIPGAGTSAGSGMLLTALDSTVFQFAAIDSVEYRLEGSCEAFWEWLQRGCGVVRR